MSDTPDLDKARDFLRKLGLSPDDVDWLAPKVLKQRAEEAELGHTSCPEACPCSAEKWAKSGWGKQAEPVGPTRQETILCAARVWWKRTDEPIQTDARILWNAINDEQLKEKR